MNPKCYTLLVIIVVILDCTKTDTPKFSSYQFIQERKGTIGITLDTISNALPTDTIYTLRFIFDKVCKNIYSITKMRRLGRHYEDSILCRDTGNIYWDGLDGPKESGISTKIRDRFNVRICHDSTLYHLSCLVPLSTTQNAAEHNLYLLIKILTCNSEACVGLYIDSLKSLCGQSMTESDRLQQR